MPTVYILQSQSSGRFYIGCAEEPVARLSEHNRGQTRSTRGRGPWLLVYQEQFKSAPRRSRGGRRFDPDQVHQISAMSTVYILRSESSGRFDIGCTEDPRTRLTEHNRGQTKSTRGRGPWLLVYQEQFRTLSEALARERQLKSWKSHRSIQELIDSCKVVERAPA